MQPLHPGLEFAINTFYGEKLLRMRDLFVCLVFAILNAANCVKSGTENLRGLGRPKNRKTRKSEHFSAPRCLCLPIFLGPRLSRDSSPDLA